MQRDKYAYTREEDFENAGPRIAAVGEVRVGRRDAGDLSRQSHAGSMQRRQSLNLTAPSTSSMYTIYNASEQPDNQRSDVETTTARSRSLTGRLEQTEPSYHTSYISRRSSTLRDDNDIVVRDREEARIIITQPPHLLGPTPQERGSAESRGQTEYRPRQYTDNLWGSDVSREVRVPAGLIDSARGWESDGDDGDTEWETDVETGEKRIVKGKGKGRNISVTLLGPGDVIRVPDAGKVTVRPSSSTVVIGQSGRRRRWKKSSKARDEAEYWSTGVK